MRMGFLLKSQGKVTYSRVTTVAVSFGTNWVTNDSPRPRKVPFLLQRRRIPRPSPLTASNSTPSAASCTVSRAPDALSSMNGTERPPSPLLPPTSSMPPSLSSLPPPMPTLIWTAKSSLGKWNSRRNLSQISFKNQLSFFWLGLWPGKG